MKFDIYQTITDRIIEQLENNEIPWRKPWVNVCNGAFNRVSKRPYSLLNQLLLSHTGEYASFKQWTELGGTIRKGEKSEFVVFWTFLKKVKQTEDGEETEEKIPVLKYYRVFHISQVEGVEPLETVTLSESIQPIERADQVIDDYVKREKVTYVEELCNKACYSPLLDMVTVPCKKQYKEIAEFYSTTFHELTHSTGHKKRLNRFDESSFGKEAYSKEELVAEIGSASILNLLGIETSQSFENSTAYISSWLKRLKNDKRLIVSAAGKAEKAIKLILDILDQEFISETKYIEENSKVITL